MKKTSLFILVLLVAVSCQPAPSPTLTPTSVPPTAIPPTATVVSPTSTLIPPTSTPAPPSPTPTVATLKVGGKLIPAPSNALLDTKNPDSPINKHARRFNLNPEVVKSELNYQERIDLNGKSFVIAVTKDSVPLLIASQNPTTDAWTWKEIGLGDLAQVGGMDFGIAVHNRSGILNGSQLNPDTDLIKREASLITTEDGLEWRYLRPTEDSFSWARSDRQITFGKDNNKKVRAQGLIEADPTRVPKWVWDKVNATNALLAKNPNDSKLKEQVRNEYLDLMTNHIRTVVGRYNDVVDEWVVSNEAFNWDGVFRKTNFWYSFIGEDYLEIALKTTRAIDHDAKLIINEPDPESVDTLFNSLYNRLKTYKDKGILRDGDGLGIQFHVQANKLPAKEQMKEKFRRIGRLGLAVYVTELDVRGIGSNDAPSLQKETTIYQDVAEPCLAVNAEFGKPVVTSITAWGYKDSDSWLLYVAKEQPQYPLLFTATLEKKPAYDAIVSAFMNWIDSMQGTWSKK